MRKRQREKQTQEIRELLNRASMELNLVSHDILRDFITPRGAVARINAACDTAGEAIKKLGPITNGQSEPA